MENLTIVLWWCAGMMLVALVVFAIWVAFLPGSIRPLFRVLLWPHYSIRVRGRENVPRKGPLMFVGNHVSWIDGFLIASVCPRSVTILVNKDYCDHRGQRWLVRRMNIIPIPSTGPKAQRIALEAMRSALDEGRTVGLFPEAQLCRSGMMTPFLRGVEMILKDKPNVVVVPIGLMGVWGSIFSFSGGKYFKKWPKVLRRRVGISFGKPLPSSTRAVQLRRAVIFEMVKAMELIPGVDVIPDTIDLELGHWKHPQFGLIAASAPDFLQPSRKIRQVAHKPGSVGQILPGMALRSVNEHFQELPPGESGKLELLKPGEDNWLDTCWRGRIDAEGFIWLESPDQGFVSELRKVTVKGQTNEPRDGSQGITSE